MLRDITLGQYYPADSVIHKLDPRVKLFATLIYIISLFCFKGIAALLAATAFLFAVIKTSKVPFKFMVKGLKAIMVLMLITALFNLFLTPGEPIVQLWIFKITAEGAQVDFPGPPFVRFRDSSNSCRVPLVDVMVVSRMVGFRSGTVILKNVCIGLAPSIFAASYTEYSMFCRPDR